MKWKESGKFSGDIIEWEGCNMYVYVQAKKMAAIVVVGVEKYRWKGKKAHSTEINK